MGKQEEPVISSVRMSFALGATLEVDGVAWVKPGVEFDVKWTGGLPSEAQLAEGWEFLSGQVAEKGQALFAFISEEARIKPRTEERKPQEMPAGQPYRRAVQAEEGSGDGPAEEEGSPEEEGERHAEDVERGQPQERPGADG